MTKSFPCEYKYFFNNGAKPNYRHKRSDLFVWIFHYALTSRKLLFWFAKTDDES